MAETERTTREWITIFKDLDAYIAKGGRLLDLPVMSQWPPQMVQSIAEELGREQCGRLGRFYLRIGKLAPPGELVGEHVTEADAVSAWKTSANK
jgi:hypothetical protein